MSILLNFILILRLSGTLSKDGIESGRNLFLAKGRKSQELALANYVKCWHRLAYDSFSFVSDFRFSGNLSSVSKRRIGEDTAKFSNAILAHV